MSPRKLARIGIPKLLVLAGLVLAARPAAAADFYLRAAAYDLTLPDTSVVRMWGYASCNADFSSCGAPSSPGPLLEVPSTEPAPVTVRIHVQNNLPAPHATSILVPSQLAPLTPARFADSLGRTRTAAFNAQTLPGFTGVYEWTNFRPGTHLYQSGSQPQVQVQMGLLGVIKYDAAAGEAYAGVPYDAEALVVYSEIDPALHAAVQAGTYGSAAYPSTLHYKPTYFLVNGLPFEAGQPPIAAGAVGSRVLLRLVNGGLQTRSPQILGPDLVLVAEDGRKYPYPSRGNSALLPAGGTKDAIFVPAVARVHALVDRALGLTANQVNGKGAYAFLSVGAAAAGVAPASSGGAPAGSVGGAGSTTAAGSVASIGSAAGATVAVGSAGIPTVTELTVATKGQPVTIALARRLAADPRSVRVLSTPARGAVLRNNRDGTVTYVPGPKAPPRDSFRYAVTLRRGRTTVLGTVRITNLKWRPRPMRLRAGLAR